MVFYPFVGCFFDTIFQSTDWEFTIDMLLQLWSAERHSPELKLMLVGARRGLSKNLLYLATNDGFVQSILH